MKSVYIPAHPAVNENSKQRPAPVHDCRNHQKVIPDMSFAFFVSVILVLRLRKSVIFCKESPTPRNMRRPDNQRIDMPLGIRPLAMIVLFQPIKVILKALFYAAAHLGWSDAKKLPLAFAP